MTPLFEREACGVIRGGKMKKIVLLIIFLFSFTSAIAYAGENVSKIDGIWKGEGIHATFELLLKEHKGKVFGALITGVGAPREWVSYTIIDGSRLGNDISFAVITDGCDGREGAGKVIIKGVVDGEILKAFITTTPLCTKKEEITFHKE